MNSLMVNRAKEIIFSMEGRYGSVNMNDNGALSVGCCQWHGDRAKALLRAIVRDKEYQGGMIDVKLFKEIDSNISWKKRIVANIKERNDLSALLNSPVGRKAQDVQATMDITKYIKHIENMGFTDEETVILLADIENQGGAGATDRIGTKVVSMYGKKATIEQVMRVAMVDPVFKNYKARRLQVFKKLTGRSYVQGE